jgi:hypothetical protein
MAKSITVYSLLDGTAHNPLSSGESVIPVLKITFLPICFIICAIDTRIAITVVVPHYWIGGLVPIEIN